MVEECVSLLQPAATDKDRSVFVDATFGAGGHTRALLESMSGATVVAIDADPAAVERATRMAREYAAGRLITQHANFGDLEQALDKSGVDHVDGIIYDLGISSLQLQDSQRGFSFAGDEPLDMRLDPRADAPTASELLATLSQDELERLLREYGDERHARAIARSIVRRRARITNWRTGDLVAAVLSAYSQKARGRIHPATRTFQALRMAVNSDLHNLARSLDGAVHRLGPQGRMVVISFHSAEDRIVKHRFRSYAQSGSARLLTPKPLRPSAREVAANVRSRSAKLRAIERVPQTNASRKER
ncbi:MAG: 16S rRNA (cytosine(1402)-N(4))-methyltransferase RsmH [Candidatus Eremiobacteraeota bacterium]|nr:16S rRNA (cytosine(1402)-N(4))-methyltransferase RsmH [Candidatus Eremiobacteraeota bacterium]